MKHKSFPIHGLKAIAGAPGQYETYYAVFNNVDLVNDRIREGAFANSLKRWKDSGDPIPMIFSHGWDSLDNHVGEVLEAEEVKAGDARLPAELKALGGLRTVIQCDMDDPHGKKMDRLLAKRRVREGSFAYDVIREEIAKDGVNDLLELDLIEVGPTLKGANPATQLLGAGAHVKARVDVEGSFEELQGQIAKTIPGWVGGVEAVMSKGELFGAGLEATFSKKAIIAASYWDAATSYFEVPYTRNGDAVEFGAPKEVTIRGVVSTATKAAPTEAKATPQEPIEATGQEPKLNVVKALIDLEAFAS